MAAEQREHLFELLRCAEHVARQHAQELRPLDVPVLLPLAQELAEALRVRAVADTVVRRAAVASRRSIGRARASTRGLGLRVELLESCAELEEVSARFLDGVIAKG
jgi:hypothetical protein